MLFLSATKPSVVQKHSSAHEMKEPYRLIHLFGHTQSCRELAATLERLNHIVQSHSLDDIAASLPVDTAPIAAIVIDDGEKSIEGCFQLSRQCPVILVSAEEAFAYRLAAAEAGVQALIRPPVNPTELAEWLRFLGGSRSCGEPTSIVIVDDDALTAELHAETLRSVGMKVDIVCDPSLALKEIEARLPDLVLMDMQMPAVSGIQLAQVIRQSRQLLSMPIVFLSNERDEGRQLKARQLGGDDFLTKPIHPERLIALVRLRAERSKQLRSMIERDGLTGLYDHAKFNERLSQELERCRRSGAELSLVIIDIDRFKTVNDSHGHPTGDAVLRTLANSLTAGLRQIDIVGRYGGEEFGIVLLDTEPDSARAVIDRIRHRFGEIGFSGDGGPFNVTFSAGIASSRRYDSLPALVQAADRALYCAKAAGRNCIQLAETRPIARLIAPSSEHMGTCQL